MGWDCGSYKAIGWILEERDNGSTSGANNNADGENAHAKAGFITYNVISADVDAGVGDTTDTDNITKEVSNNINTCASQSGGVDGVDKDGLGWLGFSYG